MGDHLKEAKAQACQIGGGVNGVDRLGGQVGFELPGPENPTLRLGLRSVFETHLRPWAWEKPCSFASLASEDS